MSASRIDRDRLSTVHLVPLTPFDSRGEIAEDVLREHFRRLADAGLRVFLPAAATSGFHQLEPDEVIRIVRLAVESLPDDAIVLAPLGLRLREAKRVACAARDAGASAALFMPASAPYLSDEGLRAFYLEVLEACGLPGLIYKRGALPSDALLVELARETRLVGVKYANVDVEAFQSAVAADGGRLAWVCGIAERYAPSFHVAGAVGFTSGAGNLAPRLSLALHSALVAGDHARARELQSILLPIERYRARAGDSYNVSMLQHGMSCLASPLEFGEPRLPMRRLSASERVEIERLLEPILAAEARLGRS